MDLIDRDGLPTPSSYTHVVAATGSRLVFVAGRVADDAQSHLVGADDLAVQARQAFANIASCLAAAGARPEQVAKITIYVVHHRPEYLPDISEARIAVFGDHNPPTPNGSAGCRRHSTISRRSHRNAVSLSDSRSSPSAATTRGYPPVRAPAGCLPHRRA